MGFGGKKVELIDINGKKYKKDSKEARRALEFSNARASERNAQTAKDDSLQKLIDTRPQYSSIADTNEYKTLLGQANTVGDLPQYALLKQQAQQAAAEGNTKLANQLNDELQNQAIAGSGAQSNAYSQLAMGGGLSGGARERIAAGGAEAQMAQAQQARLGKNRGEADIQNKLSQGLLDLGAQSEGAKTGLQTTLLGARQSDLGGQNQLAQSQHNQSMEIAAARAKGLAEENATYEAQRKKKEQSGSCWLITNLANAGVMLPANEASLLEDFKAHIKSEHSSVARWYILKGKRLTDSMNSSAFDWHNFEWFNKALVHFMTNNNHQAAFNFFENTVYSLCEKYWDDCKYTGYLSWKFDKMTQKRNDNEFLNKPCLTNLSKDQFIKEEEA
jgi:hypothetical protein